MRNKVGWILAAFVASTTSVAAAELPPSDPYYSQQSHLRYTQVDQAWKQEQSNETIIIAVLDTGVDASHPDLKSNLIEGVNLVSPGREPHDDHGHGTNTVGILAATGNNELGITGVLWKSKIMPIKVLDNKGQGEAKRVAQGIRVAVDSGAKIILLSLGDPIYSLEMKEAALYAERKGVLVVSATGNDGDRVNYPGAFPTVLTVGAVDDNLQVLSYSNRGPEVDLVAPGSQILTTSLGGGYSTVSGTSMAAPQIAGIAALILKQNPNLSPKQIRTILKSTAIDLGAKGWDVNTGFGLVDARIAMEKAKSPPRDLAEPNNTIDQAAPIPTVSRLEASLGERDPIDWYKLTPIYRGTLTVQLEGLPAKKVQISFYDQNKVEIASTNGLSLTTMVDKRTYYVEIQALDPSQTYSYTIHTSFANLPDSYEGNNDKQTAALLGNTEHVKVKGNFHQNGDIDWYQAIYPWAGQLQVGVTTDSLRMDPVLTIEQEGKWKKTIDDGSVSNRQKENWSGLISPGKVYYQVADYYQHANNGEYTLSIQYNPTPSKYFSDITRHWARPSIERVAERNWMAGYPNGMFQPNSTMTRAEVASVLQKILRLPHDNGFFTDAPSTHWATPALRALVKKGVLEADRANRIYPGKVVTRAELITMLYQAKYGNAEPQGPAPSLPFQDIGKEHEAYPYINKMYQDGLIKGTSATQFSPERVTTRAEFATMIEKIW